MELDVDTGARREGEKEPFNERCHVSGCLEVVVFFLFVFFEVLLKGKENELSTTPIIVYIFN